MQKIKHYIVSLLLVAMLMPAMASAAPLAQIGAAATCTNKPIITIPSWYKNLKCTTEERPDGSSYQQPQVTELNDIWKIALNVVEALIGAAAYIAAGFVVWGGFKYMKSQGDPGKLTEAKNAIMQALIGLGITLASTAIVIFVGSLF